MEYMTKEQAFAKRNDEVVLPIKGSYKLRRNWFKHRNQCTFSTFLPRHLEEGKAQKVLTIGVFEGAQEIWLLQQLLRHADSRLVGVDPWLATTKLDQEFMDQAHQNARDNLKQWSRKVHLVRGKSQDVLAEAIKAGNLRGVPMGHFDLVIIDGDHNKEPVYKDAVLSYEMARPGGWLLFDDVENRVEKKDHVKQALRDKFLPEYGDRVQLVWKHRYCECYQKL